MTNQAEIIMEDDYFDLSIHKAASIMIDCRTKEIDDDLRPFFLKTYATIIQAVLNGRLKADINTMRINGIEFIRWWASMRNKSNQNAQPNA